MAINTLLPGIFCADHRVAEGKNGVVLGSTRALVIDVGTDPEEGGALAAFVQQAGFAPNLVALTHGHSDHILGGLAFAGAEVFASSRTPDQIRSHLRGFAARKGLDYVQLLAQALFPTITFSDELTIDLGRRLVRLFPAPGHSPDGVCAYLAAERLLFAGDTVVTGILPAINEGDSRVLETSLNRLRNMEIDILVPGHGRVLFGAAAIQDWLAWEIGYLSGVRTAVSAALQADTQADEETLLRAAPFAELVGDRLPADRHDMETRHRNTVLKIVEEERSRLGVPAMSEGQR